MELSVDLSHRTKDSTQILTLPLELQSGASLMPLFDVKHQVLDTRATALHGRVESSVEWGGTRHHLLAGLEAIHSETNLTFEEMKARRAKEKGPIMPAARSKTIKEIPNGG